MRYIEPGSTDQSVYFYLQDAVSGGPYTTTGSETDWNLSYTRNGAAQVANNVAGALASATAAHSDNSIFHVGKGVWRADLPDAAFAAGADSVLLEMDHDSDTTIPSVIRIDLSVRQGDVVEIDGEAAPADRLGKSAGQIIPGTVDTAGGFTPTTTQFESDDITEATADHYNDRIVVFTTGNLAGQARAITDYELSGANGKFTVQALTEAPANDDEFIII